MFTGLFLAIASLLPFSLPQMNHPDGVGTLFQTKKNSVLVIESYFNTCPYCNTNADNVNQLAEEYMDHERVQVVDLGIDRKDSDYQKWINKHAPNHPVLKDADRKITNKLGTKSYPTSYVIGCDGTVFYKHVGEWGDDANLKVRYFIQQALATTCD